MNTEVSPVANLALRAIYVHSTEAKLADGFDPLVAGQQLLGAFRAQPEVIHRLVGPHPEDAAKELHSFEFRCRFEFKYRVSRQVQGESDGSVAANSDRDKLPIAAEISAVMVANFTWTGGDGVPDTDAFKEFGAKNVLHMLWPYWRELCSGTCTRLHLPVTFIPLIVMQISQSAKPPEDEASPSAATTSTSKSRRPPRKRIAG